MDRLILLTGNDGSGKDTVAKLLTHRIKGSYITNIKKTCVKLYKDLVGVDWNELNGAEKRIHRPVFSNMCEGIKVTLGKGVFAEKTSDDIAVYPAQDKIFIIPDLRFVEEYEVFLANFKVILLEVRRTKHSLIRDNMKEHTDWYIENTSDKKELEKEVDEFVKKFSF